MSILLSAFNWFTVIWDFSPKSESMVGDAGGFLLLLLLEECHDEETSEWILHSKERLLEPFPYTGLVFSLSCIKGISLSL